MKKEVKKSKIKMCALASGSSGNCFYISNGKNSILVDAGISAKQIKERLDKIGADAENIDAIFITHEHSDHTKGADVFARTFGTKIYATKKTINQKYLCSEPKLIKEIKNNGETKVGEMIIEAFSKSHEAIDPVSFIVTCGKKKVAVITDVGYACKNVIKHVKQADFVFLESNHDEEMLVNGPYPYFLKKWIKSDTGHLSNKQAGLCILEHASPKLKGVILSHLSKTNNTPETAMETFNSFMKERINPPEVSISTTSPTELFII